MSTSKAPYTLEELVHAVRDGVRALNVRFGLIEAGSRQILSVCALMVERQQAIEERLERLARVAVPQEPPPEPTLGRALRKMFEERFRVECGPTDELVLDSVYMALLRSRGSPSAATLRFVDLLEQYAETEPAVASAAQFRRHVVGVG